MSRPGRETAAATPVFSETALPRGRVQAISTHVGRGARLPAGGRAARYSVGVSPKARLNGRVKWAGDAWAARASASTSRGSA
jgi:hypothetical protein